MRARCYAILLVTLAGCGGRGVELPPPPQGGSDPLAVTTRALEPSEVRRALEAVGTARPVRAANLGPQMTGRIVELPVREGQEVASGAVVARLDPRSVALATERARASADGAGAQVRQLEQELARLSPLAATGTVPQQQIDQLELSLEAARAQASAARSGAAEARTALVNTTVRAPFAGVVSHVGMEVGEIATVMPPSLIARVVDLSELEISARVSERDLPGLREGTPATVTFAALGARVDGHVVRIAPELDPQSRTVEVVVRVPNTPERAIRGGMSARVSMHPEQARSALVLPADAARGSGPTRRVFVIDEGRAREREVRVAPLEEGTLEVLEGLSSGEAVIHPLPARVREGAPVRVQERTADAS